MKNKESKMGHPIFRIGGDTYDLIKEENDTYGVYVVDGFDSFIMAAREFIRDQWFDSNET